ncbi:(S)-canadine synthase-like [Aristolochia californica]|uniref:(S)-canadine synthase-like n=1 Tax=Aristolochia californica TaxID=171875 RepID=UPI0035D5F3F6
MEMDGCFWVAFAAMFVGSLSFLLFMKMNRQSDSKSMSWPAGPRKLPIIGNLHQLQKGGPLVHVTLAEMSKQYGNIMTVWFGTRPTLVISDPGSAWEVLVTKASDYASRTLPYKSRFVTANWRTLASSDFGTYWFILRKGVQASFFHPANVLAQATFQESDASQLIRSIGEEAIRNDGVVKPLPHLRKSTVRLIGRLCFGPDFRDEKFVDAMDVLTEDTILQTGHKSLGDVFAGLRHIPGFKQPFREAYDLKVRIEELIKPCIDRYRSKESAYLQFLLSQGSPLEVVIFNIFEMFLLAVDSTSLATTWALGFLIHDQQIQHRLYKELSEDGREGTLGIEEVSKMKYLHGLVKESTRMRPIAPLAVPHKAVKDTTLMGRRVRAGTSVIVNLYAVLHDATVWNEPHRFDPDRFLKNREQGEGEEEDAAAKKATDRSFLPFGAGRRVCAGMELAKLHVALTLGNLVKAFEWSCATEEKLPDLSEDLTFILRMKTPLLAKIVPRHS